MPAEIVRTHVYGHTKMYSFADLVGIGAPNREVRGLSASMLGHAHSVSTVSTGCIFHVAESMVATDSYHVPLDAVIRSEASCCSVQFRRQMIALDRFLPLSPRVTCLDLPNSPIPAIQQTIPRNKALQAARIRGSETVLVQDRFEPGRKASRGGHGGMGFFCFYCRYVVASPQL